MGIGRYRPGGENVVVVDQREDLWPLVSQGGHGVKVRRRCTGPENCQESVVVAATLTEPYTFFVYSERGQHEKVHVVVAKSGRPLARSRTGRFIDAVRTSREVVGADVVTPLQQAAVHNPGNQDPESRCEPRLEQRTRVGFIGHGDVRCDAPNVQRLLAHVRAYLIDQSSGGGGPSLIIHLVAARPNDSAQLRLLRR